MALLLAAVVPVMAAIPVGVPVPLLETGFAHRAVGCEIAVIVGIVILILVLIGLARASEPRLLLFLTRAIVGKDAEIVIGELQIIFGVHAVARQLRVARHIAILLEKLRCIAARAVIDPVAGISAAPVAAAVIVLARIVPTATAAGLTIVDQVASSLCTLKECKLMHSNPKKRPIGRARFASSAYRAEAPASVGGRWKRPDICATMTGKRAAPIG